MWLVLLFLLLSSRGVSSFLLGRRRDGDEAEAEALFLISTKAAAARADADAMPMTACAIGDFSDEERATVRGLCLENCRTEN